MFYFEVEQIKAFHFKQFHYQLKNSGFEGKP
jgi:hypothetical protein